MPSLADPPACRRCGHTAHAYGLTADGHLCRCRNHPRKPVPGAAAGPLGGVRPRPSTLATPPATGAPLDGPAPAWIPCPCGGWWCVLHADHAHACPCPEVSEWPVSPYHRGAPPHDLATLAARCRRG